MKLCRGRHHDFTVPRHLCPRDMETAVLTLVVGGPLTLLMDGDVPGIRSEVTGSDGPPTDTGANVEPDKRILV